MITNARASMRLRSLSQDQRVAFVLRSVLWLMAVLLLLLPLMGAKV